ncbi:MAG: putative membrane protein YfcA [Candidatus Azotimanducaceae bacterium]|jgi:uncharacterized membrane protein YfcA
MSIHTLITLAVIGLVAGILSGVVGVGGGIIMVPALVYFLSMPQHAAQGTSLAVMLPPIGILACYNYYKAGNLDWKYAAIIALTFVIGGYLGSKVAMVVDAKTLKRVFACLMFLAAIKLFFSNK